jgi:hypothetical protein
VIFLKERISREPEERRHHIFESSFKSAPICTFEILNQPGHLLFLTIPEDLVSYFKSQLTANYPEILLNIWNTTFEELFLNAQSSYEPASVRTTFHLKPIKNLDIDPCWNFIGFD